MTSNRPKTESARAGRNKPAPHPESDPHPTSGATASADSMTVLTAEMLQSMMGSLKTDIFSKIDTSATTLRSEMILVKDELKKSIERIQNKLDAHGVVLSELERGATDHSTRITELEANVGSLTTRVTYLDNRCEDLEGRMRRNNIRLLGIPEGVEGPRPTEFVAGLLQELLGLDEKPLLDRAHRTLRSRPREGEPPRPFVIRVHFFHVRNDMLKRSGDASPLLYKGRRVSIFPDYTTAVAKKRASFGDVKRQLRACPGVKYGLIYPAVLRLTLPDSSTHRFEDPAVAADFIKNRVNKAVVPPPGL